MLEIQKSFARPYIDNCRKKYFIILACIEYIFVNLKLKTLKWCTCGITYTMTTMYCNSQLTFGQRSCLLFKTPSSEKHIASWLLVYKQKLGRSLYKRSLLLHIRHWNYRNFPNQNQNNWCKLYLIVVLTLVGIIFVIILCPSDQLFLK